MKRNRAIGAALAALALASGCGGGGGGGDGGTKYAASDYWNADSPAIWRFEGRDTCRLTLGAPTMHLDSVFVLSTTAFNGASITRYGFSNVYGQGAGEMVRYLATDGIRVLLLDPTTGVPLGLDRSYLELRNPVMVGDRYTVLTQRDTTNDYTGDGVPDILDLKLDVIVNGFESIGVPAGSFSNTLHVTQRATATVTSGANGASGSAVSDEDIWYAKGIGPVRRSLQDPTCSPGSDRIVEDAGGVLTASLRAGVIGDFVWIDNTAPASSDLTNVGAPAVASDGTRFLVASKVTDAGGNDRVVGTLVDGDGMLVWSKNLISDLGSAGALAWDRRVAAAYDGQDFWVVASTPQANGPYVRQRIGADGTLLDGAAGQQMAIAGTTSGPVLASDGSGVLFAHMQYDSAAGKYGIDGAVFARDGSTIVAQRSYLAALGFQNPALAGRSGAYLLAAEDLRSGGFDLAMARIDSTGVLLDTAPLALSTAASYQDAVALTPFGTGFAALWRDWRSVGQYGNPQIYATRIGGDGSLLDGAAASGGVTLDTTSVERYGTAAASGSAGSLIVWSRGGYAGNSAPPVGIMGRLQTSAAGLATTGNASLLGLVTNQELAVRLMAPAVAAGNNAFLVAWVYNAETIGTTKKAWGVLVYPPTVQ